MLVLCLIALGLHILPDLNYESADKKLISAAVEGLPYTCWVLNVDQETAVGPDEIVFQSHGDDGSGKQPVDQPRE